MNGEQIQSTAKYRKRSKKIIFGRETNLTAVVAIC